MRGSGKPTTSLRVWPMAKGLNYTIPTICHPTSAKACMQKGINECTCDNLKCLMMMYSVYHGRIGEPCRTTKWGVTFYSISRPLVHIATVIAQVIFVLHAHALAHVAVILPACYMWGDIVASLGAIGTQYGSKSGPPWALAPRVRATRSATFCTFSTNSLLAQNTSGLL